MHGLQIIIVHTLMRPCSLKSIFSRRKRLCGSNCREVGGWIFWLRRKISCQSRKSTAVIWSLLSGARRNTSRNETDIRWSSVTRRPARSSGNFRAWRQNAAMEHRALRCRRMDRSFCLSMEQVVQAAAQRQRAVRRQWRHRGKIRSASH